MIKYKGYSGKIDYDNKAKIFFGEVINTKDVITFQGKSVSEIEKAFKDSINDYIDWCKKDNVNPEKPYSGKFNVRITPELHKAIALVTSQNDISLNKFIEKALIDELKNFE